MKPLNAEDEKKRASDWSWARKPGRKNNRPRVLGPELDWPRPMRRPEFLRFPNLRNLTCADLHQLEACYLTSPDGGSELPCQPDPRHPLSSAKVCRPCWRGPACARRARLPACEMAPCKLPRYVRSAVWCRARHPRPRPRPQSHDRIDDDARSPNCARHPAPTIESASGLPLVPLPKLMPVCASAPPLPRAPGPLPNRRSG